MTDSTKPELSLPDGYVVATIGNYPEGKVDRHSGRRYTISVQLLNTAACDCPRGIGMTYEEAFEDAKRNVMGDDGLSKAMREMMLGPKQ